MKNPGVYLCGSFYIIWRKRIESHSCFYLSNGESYGKLVSFELRNMSLCEVWPCSLFMWLGV